MITLQQVAKFYNDIAVLSNVSLQINQGELVVLIGPSGSGKTTLLKIIAGLELPSTGEVKIDGKKIDNFSPQNRNIGFVFQHYALFKNMNVFENVAFGLRVKDKKHRLSETHINERVKYLLNLVQISNLQQHFPNELSGGQRQRVALARALAVEPKILLLDEPFSALDQKLKLELRRWLRKLQNETKITIILVTHDQEEALDIADKVVILNRGSIEQIGTASEVYHNPSNSFVYNFLGNYNVFRAIKDEQGNVSIINKFAYSEAVQSKWYKNNKIVSSIVSLFKAKTDEINQDQVNYFQVFVRPHDMEISKAATNDQFLKGKISHLNLAGPTVKIELESEEYELIQAEIAKEVYDAFKLSVGDTVYARAKLVSMFLD